MRIAINCRSFLKKQYTGIGRYAYNLVDCLAKIDRQNEYSLYAQKNLFDFKRRLPRAPAKNFSVKADWFSSGSQKTLGKIDIFHFPSPDFIDIKNTKIIVTVHDLVYRFFPSGHTESAKELTDRQLHSVVERADRIICCSQNTIKDLNACFKLDQSKVSLVYQGVDKNIFYRLDTEERKTAEAVLKNKGITEEFILFVGTNEPRKNLKNLLSAFAELKRSKKFKGVLVVAGMIGWMSEDTEDVVQKLGITNSVLFLGYVENNVLRYLYNLCEVFVFPSFYEGFGFPIVEAFSCGAPVVTSNVSSCAEIAGQAALTVNPEDVKSIAQNIERMLADRALRGSFIEKSLLRGKDFSFLKTAEETLEVYRQVFLKN